MRKILLVTLFIASISCSKTNEADIYCLRCMDQQGNALPKTERKTLEWARDNSGPGKECFSWGYNQDRSCP